MFLHITLADIMVTLFPIAGQPPHLDPDSQTQLTAFTMELQTNLREYCSCTYNHKEDQTYRKIGNYLDNL